MATITFEGYMGSGPGWADLGANTLVFSGSLTDLTTAITVATFQNGTHVGSGDPGTDQCGANHMNNVKHVASGTMSVNGGGTENIDDAGLAAAECSLRIHFNHTSSVAVSGVRFYAYDGSNVLNEAVGVDIYAFERGVAATSWTLLNDDSGNVGGDNAGEYMSLADSGAATDHYCYLAVSISPESVGAKSSVDLGVTLTYS